MFAEILLAIIQAATEFLPISSSGHLVLISSLISSPDVFFFTILNAASLLAVIIFVRKEIYKLLTFDKKYKRMWTFLIIGTIPAALFGFFLRDFIKSQFQSLLFIGFTFMFTGSILLLTKDAKIFSKLNTKNSLAIGFSQLLAIFPGISRSGMTISSARFLGVKPEDAFKFSFLLFIPISIGALILEAGQLYFSWTLLVSFVLTFLLSLISLNLLHKIVLKRKFWMFSIYCFLIGIVSLIIYFLS
jgi:undecaprenyl-diphosphatase